MLDKRSLRELIKEKRRHFSQQKLGEMSSCICHTLLADDMLRKAEVVLMYYPLPSEVDVTPVIRELSGKGKVVLLPKVVSDTDMTIHKYEDENSLCVGAFNIMEPVGEEYMDYDSIDVVIVPGMAFDIRGNRLGKGKGYYDRFFSRVRNIYKIGVCFPYQMVDDVPCDEHDIRMDKVICD